MRQTGVLLHVQSLDFVKVVGHDSVNRWSLPLTPIDRLITGYRVRDLGQRMHIRGVVTYFEPGSAALASGSKIVLQDGSRSMWVTSNEDDGTLRVGDEADAIGFPDVQNGFLMLTESEVRSRSVAAPVTPPLLSWRELATGGNAAHGHAYDLVSIEGQVVAEVRQVAQDSYVLEQGGHLFSAIVSHPEAYTSDPLRPMRVVPVGARIRVTGICMLEEPDPFSGDVPFHILMRSYDDIAVVTRPSPINVRHLIVLISLLLLVIFALGIWSWCVERKRRRESVALAYLERRRNLILNEVNGACSLSQTIEDITELVTFKLHGAACWYEVENGSCFGQRPATITSQRIVRREIRSRSGAPLGTLSAALPRFAECDANESAAMALGADLAKLAIETSHLYGDLVRRSEFDLLTDVPNRFSLEKQVDALIEEAAATGGILGFIFIDLDRFKQINDRYGHRAGDVYLQEVARRMKSQLRPRDVFARLGGDEFGAAVPAARNRAEVEEIALRLERCFDEPFVAEGYRFQGSASLGFALYPEDATGRESLLSAADAAMYAAKNSRRAHAPAQAQPTVPVTSA
jgi:diguanylate cyclase (GGDEF)-like protein